MPPVRTDGAEVCKARDCAIGRCLSRRARPLAQNIVAFRRRPFVQNGSAVRNSEAEVRSGRCASTPCALRLARSNPVTLRCRPFAPNGAEVYGAALRLHGERAFFWNGA